MGQSKRKATKRSSGRQSAVARGNGIEARLLGKSITMRNIAGPAERRQFAEGLRQWRDGLPTELARLEETIRRFDAMEVLATAMLRDAIANPETYKEYEHGSPIVIEHLAVMYAKAPLPEATENLDPAVMQGVFEALDRLIMYWPFAFEPLDLDINFTDIMSVRMRVLMHETMVRMPSYRRQIKATTAALFTLSNEWLEKNLGFTANQALQLVASLTAIGNDHLNEALQEARNIPEAFLAAAKATNDAGIPESFRSLVTQLQVMTNEQQSQWLASIGRSIAIKTVGARAPFTAEELSQKSGIDLERTQAFLEIFTLASGDIPADYVIPTPANPLKFKPILALGDGRYFVPSVMLLEPALQFRFEEAMNPDRGRHPNADRHVWNTYVAHRGAYAEAAALGHLARALPGATVYRDLKYSNAGQEGELDGLILFDRYALFVEVKAGTFSPQARSGNIDALVADVEKLIGHPHEQGERAIAYVSTGNGSFRLPDRSRLMLDQLTFDHSILVTVTLEQLGQLTAALNEVPQGALQAQSAWAVSLHDLEVIADHVGQPAAFLQYIKRRIQFNAEGGMIGYDELDWFGRYLYDSLELNDVKDLGFNTNRSSLMSHTTDLDAYELWLEGVRKTTVEKPVHQLQANVARVISEMHFAAPSGWVDVAMVLLDLPHKLRRKFDREISAAIKRGRPIAFSCVTHDGSVQIGVSSIEAPPPELQGGATRTVQLKLSRDGYPVSATWLDGRTVQFRGDTRAITAS